MSDVDTIKLNYGPHSSSVGIEFEYPQYYFRN